MNLIRLDDLIINKNLSSLTINGREVSLDPKLFELLMLFCENNAQIISRQHILDSIWPDSIVTDNAVNKLVASLRKVLNDDPKAPRYIQTVPKRGYRLIADVETVTPSALTGNDKTTLKTSAANQQPSPVSNQTTNNRTLKRKATLLAVISLLTVLAYLALLWRPSSLTATPSVLASPVKTQELTRLPGLERSPLMSEDHTFIVYLRENQYSGHRSLWWKNLSNEKEMLIDGLSPYVSRLVSLDTFDNHWQLLYLAQENNQCRISMATLDTQYQITDDKKLFDCTGQRIFDVSWSKPNNTLYYSAKTNHESVSRIYQYDLVAKTHQLITQPDAQGYGNRGIDLSPDGNKLLIVRLDNKFRSQLYVLNVNNNQLTSGLKLPYNIEKATWRHDSTHIMYLSPSPSNQVLISDIYGKTPSTLLSVSEYLETELTRINDSQDILFSTTNLDFNNRWVFHVEEVKELNNSTVYDMQPTLAHTSLHYAFVSTRTGQEQLYYGDLTTGASHAMSRMTAHRWLKHLSFSPNDKHLLAGDHSAVWLIDVEQQLKSDQLLAFSPDNALFSTQDKLLVAIWLNADYLYFKIEANNEITGYIFDRVSKRIATVDKRWQTLLTDHKTADTLYLIDSADSQIYQMPMTDLVITPSQQVIKFPEHAVQSTGVKIPRDYYDIKIHDKNIYYVMASNTGNSRPYDFQIEVKPLNVSSNEQVTTYKTSCSCGYDIADSGFIVSEQVRLEGDVHRTVH